MGLGLILGGPSLEKQEGDSAVFSVGQIGSLGPKLLMSMVGSGC